MFYSINRVRFFCLNLLTIASLSLSFNAQAALPPVPDLALQQCITDAALLNNWNVVADVTALDCSNKNITDIIGLEQYVALQSLNLAGNNIADIFTLSQLFNLPSGQQLLTRLELQNNRISDVSALISANQLLSLDLSDNFNITINDVMVILQNNPSIIDLGVASVGGFYDLFPLTILSNLQTLNMRNTGLVEIFGVERLNGLQSLDVSQNNITDISALNALVYMPPELQVLTQLNLSSNQIADVTVLIPASSLARLDLSDNNGISFNDVQIIIQNNPNLTHLGLAGVRGFVDLFALNNLIALQELNMQNTGLTYIAGVENFSNLTALDLSHNKVSDIYLLSSFFNIPAELQTLKQLKLNDNKISDVSALNGAAQLVVLDISGNNNLSFSAVQPLVLNNPQLTHLGIGDVQGLGGFFDLGNLTDLTFLNVSNTGLFDLMGIEIFPKLESLDVSRNKIVDIVFLTSLFNNPENLQLLKYLDLSENKITDVGALLLANQLISLNLSDNFNIALGDVMTILQNNSRIVELGLAGIQGFYDLSLLGILPGLQELNMRDTGLVEIFGVEQFSRLQKLDVSENNITDISALNALVYMPPELQVLTQLNLSSNQIADATVLIPASSLARLDLSYNNGILFYDVQLIIQNNPGLTHLGLAGMRSLVSLGAFYNLTGLQELNMQNTGLFSIAGVDVFSELVSLNVSDNDISDISLLNNFFNIPAELQTLKQLKLNNNRISDISALNGAAQLTMLDVSGNNNLFFSDVQSLILNNPQLTHLGIGDVQGPGNLLALSNLTDLTFLNVSNTGLTDLMGVEIFTKLESLDVSRNKISDLVFLSSLFNNFGDLQLLKFLDLSDNMITDVSALNSSNQLISLNLSDNFNIALNDAMIILQNNPGIVELGLADIQGFYDLSLLSILPDLQALNMRNTGLVEIFGVRLLSRLQKLDVSENSITDINALNGLVNAPPEFQTITQLNVNSNQLTDISVLDSAVKLTRLDLSDNAGITFASTQLIVQNNPGLTHLGLAGVKGFVDLFAFGNLIELQELNMQNTGLTSIVGVEKLKRLKSLDVSHNRISDIFILSDFFNIPAEFQILKQLKLNNNQITDISALNGAVQLTVLDVSGNNNLLFSAVQPLVLNNPQLTHLGIGSIQGLGSFFDLGNLTDLTFLNVSNTGLFDLIGIEMFTKLESLDVSRNEIVDIIFLTSLFNNSGNLQLLKHLDLSDNKISDVGALLSANQLISLNLSDNLNISINDVMIVLQNNPSIINLGLAGVDGFYDLFQLTILPNLQTLNMRNTGLVEIFGVELLNSLQALDVSQNNITDIGALNALVNMPPELQALTQLNLSENQIVDISVLDFSTKLTRLDLSDNAAIGFANVQLVIQNNLNLTRLSLAGVQGFVDLFPLSNLTALRELNMRNTGLVSINGVELFNELEMLNVSGNDIVDINALNVFFTVPAELQNLKRLDLSANRITDIFPIVSASGLTQLDLSDNFNIAFYEVQLVLQNNQGLKQLGLAGVQGFFDLFELQTLTELQELNMRNTGLNYLAGIENLINLESLDVSDNTLPDLDPMGVLFNMPADQQKLKYLDFSNNSVLNLFALNSAAALKFVDATLNNQIGKADVQFLYNNNPGVTVLVTDYDLNADGVITGLDYSLFRTMQASNDPLADFDGDGVVTAADFVLLRNAM